MWLPLGPHVPVMSLANTMANCQTWVALMKQGDIKSCLLTSETTHQHLHSPPQQGQHILHLTHLHGVC